MTANRIFGCAGLHPDGWDSLLKLGILNVFGVLARVRLPRCDSRIPGLGPGNRTGARLPKGWGYGARGGHP